MISNNQRLPITTYLGHTDRALSFYESNSLYFGLGKSSDWEGEGADGFIPPMPSMDLENIEELACLKKVTQKNLVYPSESGEIEFDGQNWKVITPEKAKELKSRWVYITATLKYNEVDLLEYRQIGLFNRVVPKSGVTDSLLLPSQIDDLGFLIAVNNRHVVTRQQDTRDTYSLIIEF